jgi:hypothetical protein
MVMPHHRVDDAKADVGVLVVLEPRGWANRLGPTEVGQGDQDRVQDDLVLLGFQHAEERAETRVREAAVQELELPEDARTDSALDRAEARAEPDRSV